MPSRPCIIGLGCSAGGVEALKQIVHQLPRLNAPYVIVQHLSPSHESMMVKILERLTSLPIKEAEDGDTLEPNHIYITPPGQLITVENETIHLQQINAAVDRTPLHTVDTFLQSIASEYGSRANAVILSGSGTDGVRGCRFIKEAGGTVIAQNPQTAQFKSMPQSIVNAGIADLVANIEDISPGISSAFTQYLSIQSKAEETIPSSSEFENIISLISNKSGINFTRYKDSTLKRRIHKRMAIVKTQTINDYYEYLKNDRVELNAISKEFLIGVTSFFRDQDKFESLRTTAIQNLIENVEAGGQIRVWVPACSTGEEAYSIAMLIEDAKRNSDKEFDYKIFGTDIDDRAITMAQKACYPSGLANDISDEFRKKYVREAQEDEVKIVRSIKDRIVFSKHDIIEDPPFGRMDLISFRNCSIYLNKQTQNEILTILEHSLKIGGFLFLGSSETIPKESTMEVADPTAKIYKKNSHRLIQNKYDVLKIQNERLKTKPTRPKTINHRDQLFLELGHSLLGNLLPPSMVVDQNGQLLHIFGDVSAFATLRPGSYEGNLFDFLHETLKSNIQTTIKRHQKEGANIGESLHISIRNFAPIKSDLVIEIVPFQPKSYDSIYLIMFHAGSQKVNSKFAEDHQNSQDEMAALKDELDQSRKDLDFTVENLETTNEELQSTNEELVTSNEELQSTNEELQSVNEELHTMNAEFQDKIEELSQTNKDMETLLAVSKVGTLFVDENLCIRKMSEEVMRAMDLRSGDVGRPISHFHNPLYSQFIDDCNAVLASGKAIEHQIKIDDFGWALVKIHPYVSYNDKKDGLVILIINIAELRALQDSQDWMLKFLLSSDEVNFSIDKNGKIDFWPASAEKYFGMTNEQAIGSDETLLLPLKSHADVRIIHEQLSAGHPVYLNRTFRIDGKNQVQQVTLIANGRYDERGKLDGCNYTLFPIDINDPLVKKVRNEIKTIRQLLDNNPLPIFVVNKSGNVDYVNKSALDIFEKKAEDVYSKKHSASNWQATDLQGVPLGENDTAFKKILTSKKPISNRKIRIVTGKGNSVTININGAPIYNEKDVTGAVFSFYTIEEN